MPLGNTRHRRCCALPTTLRRPLVLVQHRKIHTIAVATTHVMANAPGTTIVPTSDVNTSAALIIVFENYLGPRLRKLEPKWIRRYACINYMLIFYVEQNPPIGNPPESSTCESVVKSTGTVPLINTKY